MVWDDVTERTDGMVPMKVNRRHIFLHPNHKYHALQEKTTLTKSTICI